jgi:hypothetical protein
VLVTEPLVIKDSHPDGGDLEVPGCVATTVWLFGAACIDDDHDWERLKLTCEIGRCPVQAMRWTNAMEGYREDNIRNSNCRWWVALTADATAHDANATAVWGWDLTWHGIQFKAYCVGCVPSE